MENSEQLYYARTVNNKLIVALSNIGTQQASATKFTNEAISQLLYYVATYPSNGKCTAPEK